MYSKHFYELLNYNDVLDSMMVRHFAIRISLTIHFFARSISVNDECAWENGDGFEHGVSPTIYNSFFG
jgi:hypothetical protein